MKKKKKKERKEKDYRILPGLRKSSNCGMHGEYGDPAPFSNLMVVVNVVVAVVVDEGAVGEGVVVGELLLVGKDCDVVTGLVHSEISSNMDY